MSRVLIVHPDLSRLGGIESYYRKLFPEFAVRYASFGIAARPGERTRRQRLTRMLGDYLRFWRCLAAPDIDIVHLNPSLEPRSFYREALFARLARLRGKRVVVFFRGWSVAFERQLDRDRGRRFRLLYGRADVFIVLAEGFARALGRWGVSAPVYREVTIIDDATANAFDLDPALAARARDRRPQVLFVGRLKRAKGLLETIEAFALLKRAFPQARLVIAGDGELADTARARVAELGVADVAFTGAVDGAAKYELYRDASVLCFPTAHDEGFPNTVVEAMAFGLPVVTCAIGGLADFFRDGVHGRLLAERDATTLAAVLAALFDDAPARERMARVNHAYARAHFLASGAAARLAAIYASLRAS